MIIFLEGSLLKKNSIKLSELPDPEHQKMLWTPPPPKKSLLDPPPGILVGPHGNSLLAYNLSLYNCHWSSEKSQYIKNCVALTTP